MALALIQIFITKEVKSFYESLTIHQLSFPAVAFTFYFHIGMDTRHRCSNSCAKISTNLSKVLFYIRVLQTSDKVLQIRPIKIQLQSEFHLTERLKSGTTIFTRQFLAHLASAIILQGIFKAAPSAAQRSLLRIYVESGI